MRVLLAFDKFKDALSAHAACAAAVQALKGAQPAWRTDSCPLADGGEGFADILTEAAGGRLIAHAAVGPRGEARQGHFGLVPLAGIPRAARARLGLADGPADGTIAVIEMAAVSGLALVPRGERDPWQATTYGTGELILAAARAGVRALVLGVGGSATNDLGLGALAALGLRCLGPGGAEVSWPIPAQWGRIERLAGGLPANLPPIFIACDVENPLLGEHGATAVYGPQKGLRAGDWGRLEGACAAMADRLIRHFGRPPGLSTTPGSGAAGGLSFGLMAGTGAQLLPGFDLVADWLDLSGRLAAADLVLTGEGRFDDSSLSGKGPGAVARRALTTGKAVHVFAGQVTVARPPAGLTLHAISPPEMPLGDALAAAERLLADSVRRAFAA